MNRVGIDTNVVVSFVTDRNARQQARASELFGAATSGELVTVLHQTVVTEAVYVMCNFYEVKPNAVSGVMCDLLSLPGVIVTETSVWPDVWNLWPRHIKDFGDACLVAIGKAGGFDALATFDRALATRARRQSIATYW